MNLSTVALLLLAWQLLGNKNNQKTDFSQYLSDDTRGILDCVAQLSDKNGDKMGAILQMMNNPMFAEMTSGLWGNKKGDETTAPPQEKEFTNDEGYKFKEPTANSREFFRPIENIADAEVKNKLYRLYEDWYVKN